MEMWVDLWHGFSSVAMVESLLNATFILSMFVGIVFGFSKVVSFIVLLAGFTRALVWTDEFIRKKYS